MNTRVLSAVLALSFLLAQTGPGFADTLSFSDPTATSPTAVPIDQSQTAYTTAQQQIDQMNYLQTLSGPVTSAATTSATSATAAAVPDFSISDPDGNYSVSVSGGAATAVIPSDSPFGYYRYRMNLSDLSSFTLESRSWIFTSIGTQTQVNAAANPSLWQSALTRLSDNLKTIRSAQTNASTVQSLQALIDQVDQALIAGPGGIVPPTTPPSTLQTALNADAVAKDAFTTLFAYRIVQIGEAATVNEVSSQSGFNLQNFLTVLVKARQLHAAMLQGSNGGDFLTVFDKIVPPSSYPPSDTVGALFNIAGDPNFNLSSFTTVLGKAASLYRALQADDTARTVMNQRFGTQIQAAGNLVDGASRTTLFNLAGDPNFIQADFLAQLNPASTSAAAVQLQAALQADPAALDAFRTLFAYKITQIGESGTIADVANQPNFDLQGFMTVVVKARQLHAALINTPNAVNFNLLFNQGVVPPSASPNAGQVKAFFDLAGDPAFSLQAFLAVLPKAASLLQALQANPKALYSFNAGFGVQAPSTGNVSDDKTRATFFNVTGATAPFVYDETALISQLIADEPGLRLISAVQSTPGAQTAFGLLFGARISSVGDTAVYHEVANQPGFDPNVFIPVLLKAAALHAGIQQAGLAGAFSKIFDGALPAAAPPDANAAKALFDLAGTPGFDQTAFLPALSKAASLLAALQADPAALAAYNGLYAALPASGNIQNEAARSSLFQLTGNPAFNESVFLFGLKGQSAPGAALFSSLQSVSGAVQAFDALYGTTLSSGAASQADLDLLNNVATGWCYPQNCGFDVTAYIPVLLKTHALYVGLVTSGLGNDFNRMHNHLSPWDPYGAPAFMNGSKPSDASLKNLFNLAGDPAFNMAAYLTILPKAASLTRALGADPAALAAFNLRFGTTLKEIFFYKGYWPSLYAPEDGKTLGTLFNLTGDPNFSETGFIAWLKSTAPPPPGSTGTALLTALQATAGAEQAFDTLFYPSIAVKGKTAVLDEVASPSGFDITGFVNVLMKAQPFYAAITASAVSKADFAALFGEPIPSAVPNQTPTGLNGNGIRIVFGLVGDPAFDLPTFIDALTKAGSLVRALQADDAVRTAFNQRYGAVVPSAGALTDGGVTCTALFNVVEASGYDEAALLASLKNVAPPPPSGGPTTDWLKSNQAASPYGLLESYPSDPSADAQGFTYDEAVTGMLFLGQGDLNGAKRILNFFKSRWDGSGFLTVYNTQTQSGSVIETDRILGPTAWVGLFALQDYKLTGDVSSLDLADKIGKWILTLPRTGGGVAMGAAGTFWADKYSVENNLDAYAVFRALSQHSLSAADRAMYAGEAGAVKSWLLIEGYNSQTGLFRRGGYLGGNVNALDVNAWAVLALGPQTLKDDFGIDPDQLLARTEAMLAVQPDGSFGGNVLTAKGFDFSGSDNALQIGRIGVKWVEGTNHMILAYKLMANYHAERGDYAKVDYYSERANYFSIQNFRSLAPTSSGEGYVYTDTPGAKVFADNPYWLASSGPSTAATAWVYFSRTDFNPFLF